MQTDLTEREHDKPDSIDIATGISGRSLVRKGQPVRIIWGWNNIFGKGVPVPPCHCAVLFLPNGHIKTVPADPNAISNAIRRRLLSSDIFNGLHLGDIVVLELKVDNRRFEKDDLRLTRAEIAVKEAVLDRIPKLWEIEFKTREQALR